MPEEPHAAEQTGANHRRDLVGPEDRELLMGAYRDFNARRLDAVLARMHPKVEWPNGWEGGYVHGHEGVRDYWTRQWAVLDPRVDPLTIEADEAGRLVVRFTRWFTTGKVTCSGTRSCFICIESRTL